MREEWENVKLGDCINLLNGYAFKSKFFTDNSDDLVLIKGSNIGKGSILWDKSMYWNKSDEEKYSKFLLKPLDIILAMDRTWVSGGIKFAMIKKGDPKSLLVQRVACIRATEKIDQLFLKFVIASDEFSSYIKNIQGGVGVPHISPKQVKNFRFSLPPLPIQKKIASTLSAYDDLIENNLRRIKLLEEQAQLTYEEWFVRMRFPGYESVGVDAETGLPVGWQKVKLKETPIALIDGDRGKNYPKQADFFDNEYCLFLNTGNVTANGFKFDNLKFITQEKDELLRKGKLQSDDIILTTRGTIGNVSFYKEDISYKNVRINSGMLIIRCDEKKVLPNFIYHVFISELFQKKVQAFSYGSAQPQLPVGTLNNIKVVIPELALQHKFSDFVEINIKNVINLQNQNRLLQEARDILLPRLMMGLVDVEKI